ncbi:hypothetical protein AD998_01900 [bacterium 336/3]|nr:hypothetical protein AD998_01900 [bacterium 336/3]
MKKILPLLLFISSIAIAQTPIDIAENTFKVAAVGQEVFYFGFAEGDQLIFSFQEVNGKELKEIEISEWNVSSKFMDYKSKKIDNKVLNINKTGIYQFRFYNSSLGGRVCKFKLQRIPMSDATKKFDSNVYKRIVYDTIYNTVKENYLVKKEYKPISIVPVTDFYVNSGSNATFKNGKSRITVPVNLPKNTQEWYYEFSASREKSDINKAKLAFNLLGQLSKLVDKTGATSIGINMLTAPPGSDYCDVYLLDYNNSQLFELKAAYSYFTSGTRLNIKSGIVKMPGGAGQTFYIGIKNPNDLYGIQAAIDVVAIVLEEEWATREVKKPTVTSKELLYLKN